MFYLILFGIWALFVLYFLYQLSIPYFTREKLRPPKELNDIELPRVSVIIPARNEEDKIFNCVTALTNMNYPLGRLRILVVDDNSTDKTKNIIEDLAKKHPNVHLVLCPTLPEDWTGKNFACMAGANMSTGEWLCFIDADTTVAPDFLKSAVYFGVNHNIDLLSVISFQEMVSLAERLFMPPIFLAIASSINFNKVNDPSQKDSLASGQCMLFKSQTYLEIGGHNSVKAEIMEDIKIAKVVKDKGYRLHCIFAEDLIKTRMYKNFKEIWQGFSKNLTEIMRDSNIFTSLLTTFRAFLLGLGPIAAPLFVYYLVYFDKFGNTSLIFYLSVALVVFPTLLMFLFNIMTSKEFKIPLWYGLLFPFGFTLFGIINLLSFFKLKRGKIVWKDRIYSAN